MLNYECKVETMSPIRRELTISVKSDSIKEYIDRSFETLKKTAALKGFRKGKVPLSVLKQYYLHDVKSDVFSKVVRESYMKAIEENKIMAVGMPEIEAKENHELADDKPLTFTAKIEVFPEFEIKDLSKVKVTRLPTEVTDADIEKSIQNLRDSHGEMVPFESHEGPAKDGDYLDISFKGTVDGEALDVLQGENRLIQIGSKQYMEEFENALIGMKKAQIKDFEMDFPNDFSEPRLAGKAVKFNVTVHEFKKKELPAFDDEFAKRFKVESVTELRKKLTETLTEDRERESRDKLKEAVLESLNQAHDFEVPRGLVRSQLEYLVKENTQYLKQQGFTEKMTRDYLDKNQEMLTKRAEEQVRASLILDKIADTQQIKAAAADLDHEYSKVAGRINIPLEQVKQLYERDEEAMRQLRFRIKEDRAIDYVLSQVKVTQETAKKKP